MAENRYSTLLKENCHLYTEGSPVILEAYAVLKDNVTDGILTQVKFSNIAAKVISCVIVSVDAFDITGAKLEGVEQYQYLDLNAYRDEFFGQKKAIPMPNAVTRSVNIHIEKVVFSDGEMWQAGHSAVWERIPAQQTLTEHYQNPEQVKQYMLNAHSANCTYMPQRYKDLQLCTCGTVCSGAEMICHKCRCFFFTLYAISDEQIAIDTEARLAKEKENAEVRRKNTIYESGLSKLNGNTLADCEEAMKLFASIPGWKDSQAQIDDCRKRIVELKKRERLAAEKAEKKKRNTIIGILAAVLAATVFFVVMKVIIPNKNYNAAAALREAGKYEEAIAAFTALDGHKDSEEQITETKYQQAKALRDAGKYEKAITAFKALNGYKDSAEQVTVCETAIKDNKYNAATALRDAGKYEKAITAFKALNGYKDSAKQIAVCETAIKDNNYNAAAALRDAGKYEEAIATFTALNGYKDSEEQIVVCETAIKDKNYNAAAALRDAGKYEEAIAAFTAMNGYKDSAEQVTVCETAIKVKNYNVAAALRDAGRYEEAIAAFTAMNGYKDSEEQITGAIKDIDYNAAVALRNAGKYEEAIMAFTTLNGYKDSAEQITVCETAIKDNKYNAAVALRDAGKYEEAISAFTALNGYKDSAEQITGAIKDNDYKAAAALREAGKYEEAITAFTALDGYKDSAEQITMCETTIKEKNYNAAVALRDAGKYEEAIAAFKALNGYKDSAKQIAVCETAIKDNNYKAAAALREAGKYEEAIAAFTAMNGYKDSVEQINAIKEYKYSAAAALRDAGKYEEAIAAFMALIGYKDSGEQIMETKYWQAKALLEMGKYQESYALFTTISGYKDVDNLIATDNNLSAAAHAAYIAQYDVGKTVTFGSYAGERIEWLVLEAKGDERVLISVKGLEAKPYNEKYTDVTWETCTLRKWLNGEFFNTAFSPEEQAQIVTAKVTADRNPDYSTDPGKDTEDKVWLLSITEVNKYFANGEARMCAPTTHAVKNRAYQSSSDNVNGTGACWWCLRSPGSNSDFSAFVFADGLVNSRGRSVGSIDECVRPVITLHVPYVPVDEKREQPQQNQLALNQPTADAAANSDSWKVGATVSFGNYAGEPIEWLVLEANGDERVLISVKGLEAVPFNKSISDGNKWSTSYVRSWLNGMFYNEAFSAEEKEKLINGVTGDIVYLLSVEEAKKYFANDEARRCTPTKHAVQNGAYQSSAVMDSFSITVRFTANSRTGGSSG